MANQFNLAFTEGVIRIDGGISSDREVKRYEIFVSISGQSSRCMRSGNKNSSGIPSSTFAPKLQLNLSILINVGWF